MHHAPPLARASRRETIRALALDGTFVGRAALAAVLAWWAVVLLLPGRTFGGGSGAWFMTHAPEPVWAAFCGSGAIVCGSALFVRRPGWRLASALYTACVFGVLAWGYWAANPRSGNTGTHLVLAAWANWLAWRNAVAPPDAPCRGCVCRNRWCGAKRGGGGG